MQSPQQQKEMEVLYKNPDQTVFVAQQPRQVIPQSFTSQIIFSCCVFWCCGCLFGVIAFILAMLATQNADRNPVDAQRWGKWSMIVSIIGLVIGILSIIFTIVVFILHIAVFVQVISERLEDILDHERRNRTNDWNGTSLFDRDHNGTGLFNRDNNRTSYF